MLHTIKSPNEEMNQLDFGEFAAKLCLTNLGVFGLATLIDPQWVTVAIAGISAIFPAQFYYHRTRKTKLENKILEKQLNED